jgi:hypothetical protein
VWRKIIGVEKDGFDNNRIVVLEEKNGILFTEMNGDIS